MSPLRKFGIATGTVVTLAGGWIASPYLHRFEPAPLAIAAAHAADGAPLYYQDPDNNPIYSSVPGQTATGRAYRPVYADKEKSGLETAEITKAGDGPAGAADKTRKIKFYRNPMGLPDFSPVPKKDSMGMDYIPVLESEGSDDSSVTLSPGKIQRSGVKSEPAAMRVIGSIIRAPGTIQLDERRVSVISMRSEAWIQKIENVTTGSRVRKGEPLMEIYSPAISSAAAEYVAVRGTESPSGTALSNGAKQRLMNLNVPESTISAIERAHTAPLSVTWTAPRDGIVLERNAIEGMRVAPGDVLFRMADTSVVWTLIDVAERDLAWLATSQSATIKARGLPGRSFHGSITVIYPQVNKESRTVRVRIELPNTDLALLPDMYVDAEIDVGSPAAVLAIPESAMLDSGSIKAVFLDKGDGRLEPRSVQIGNRGGGYVEIRQGLADGDRVVVSANFLVDAESNLNAALKGYSDAAARQ